MTEIFTPKNIFVVLAVIGVGLFATLYPRENSPEAFADDPALFTFSNTMAWDPHYEKLAQGEVHYFATWQESIALAPPPENTSAETATELANLVADKKLRTPEKLAEIHEEVRFDTMPFGGRVATDYFDATKYPKTAVLLQKSFQDLDIIVLALKKHFDRVRPHFLAPEIEPVITVPGHPAYPSGHSTQAHFLAYVFAELAPTRSKEFLAEADRIARNREIAGLHYPSDSRAGAELARQFFTLLLTSKEFTTRLEEARAEW